MEESKINALDVAANDLIGPKLLAVTAIGILNNNFYVDCFRDWCMGVC